MRQLSTTGGSHGHQDTVGRVISRKVPNQGEELTAEKALVTLQDPRPQPRAIPSLIRTPHLHRRTVGRMDRVLPLPTAIDAAGMVEVNGAERVGTLASTDEGNIIAVLSSGREGITSIQDHQLSEAADSCRLWVQL